MKVKNLIKLLSKFDGDFKVAISSDPEGNCFREIDVVQLSEFDKTNNNGTYERVTLWSGEEI